MNIGIVLAAGNSKRFENSIPKQFNKLDNKMIIDYSVTSFQKSKLIDKIIIVVPREWENKISTFYPNHIVVTGGSNRQSSSYKGLMKCPKNTKKVLIHDAARPFISTKLIDECVSNLTNFDVVVTSLQSTDTVIRVSKGKILNIEDRNELFLNQTPQGFKFNIILEAHKKNIHKVNTDDLSLINYKSKKCKIIKGTNYNFKISNLQDLEIAKALLEIIKSRTQ